jgi:signal peptidase I
MKLTARSAGIAAILAALLLVHTIIFFLPPSLYDTYFNIVRPISYIIILIFTWFCFGRNLRIYQGQKTFVMVAVLGLTLYLSANFIIGLVVGFAHNAMDLSLLGVLRSGFAYILIIVIQEFLRSFIMTRIGESNKYWKLIGVAVIFSFISINSIGAAVNYNLFAQAGWVFTVLLPAIVMNLWLSYAALNGGLKGNLIYAVGINLFLFFMPILPNIPQILDAITIYCVTFIMFIVYDSIEWKAKRKSGIEIEYKDRRRWEWTIIPSVFLIGCILFGLGVFPIIPVAVASNSMSDEFKRGDIIYVRRINPDDIEVGDIVQYTHGGISIVHRVVEIRYDTTQGRYFVFKGDENPLPDMWPVFDNQIVGRVRYKTPFIGWPSLLFRELK